MVFLIYLDAENSCLIEIFPTSQDNKDVFKKLSNVIECKLKSVEQKLKKMHKLIGLKDLNEDFVLENKIFEIICGLRQFVYNVNLYKTIWLTRR